MKKTVSCTYVGFVLATAMVLIMFAPVSATFPDHSRDVDIRSSIDSQPMIYADNSTMFVVSNLSRPITSDDMNQTEQYVKINHFKIYGLPESAVMVSSRPVLTKIFSNATNDGFIDGSIIAYGYAIRNRTVYQYTAVVPSDRSSAFQEGNFQEVRERAKIWFYGLPKTAPPLVPKNSERVLYTAELVQDTVSKPYGVITDRFGYDKSGYINDNKQYFEAIHGYTEIEPGVHRWTDSNWRLARWIGSPDYSITHDYSSTQVL